MSDYDKLQWQEEEAARDVAETTYRDNIFQTSKMNLAKVSWNGSKNLAPPLMTVNWAAPATRSQPPKDKSSPE